MEGIAKYGKKYETEYVYGYSEIDHKKITKYLIGLQNHINKPDYNFRLKIAQFLHNIYDNIWCAQHIFDVKYLKWLLGKSELNHIKNENIVPYSEINDTNHCFTSCWARDYINADNLIKNKILKSAKYIKKHCKEIHIDSFFEYIQNPESVMREFRQ